MRQNYEHLIKKFINILMKEGEKNKANKLVRDAFFKIKLKTRKNPFFIFEKAVANVSPVVFFTSTKRGGRFYNLPIPLKKERGVFIGMRWIIQAANERSIYGFSNKLCEELIQCSKGNSEAVKKKQSIYEIVIDGRPFLRH